MIVSISRDLRPRLLDAADFRAFRVDVPSGIHVSEIARGVGPVVVFESDEVAWVSERWLREQAADAAWLQGLTAMVEKARPHRWVRDEPEVAIRAHVARAEK